MGTRMVQIRIAEFVWAFRNKTSNVFGAQIRLHQRYKTANEFRISHAAQLLLHLANNIARTQIHNYLCQECGGYRQGYMVELRSIVFYSREERVGAKSEVLEMLEVKDDRWFGRLDDSPKVKSMRRVYPRVDYTQAPWTVVMLRQPSQSIHTSREA